LDSDAQPIQAVLFCVVHLLRTQILSTWKFSSSPT
jgi:hypothetical protein